MECDHPMGQKSKEMWKKKSDQKYRKIIFKKVKQRTRQLEKQYKFKCINNDSLFQKIGNKASMNIMQISRSIVSK